MKREVNIFINITLSKIMSFTILLLAFVMDLLNDRAGTVFMFAIPFVAGLVVGKQYFDKNKEKS